VKVFWLHLGEYSYEASEKYILEGKNIEANKQVMEVVLENYGE
jgi:hypothetical protein